MNDAINNEIRHQLRESAALMEKMAAGTVESIAAAADLIGTALRKGNKLLLCGNGGSAADCQHLAAELVGRYKRERRGVPAIALTTDTSILTSVGNDYGYKEIFRRQVEALGREGDVLLGISTSGRSANVIEALREAGRLGMKRIVLIGGKGGEIGDEAEVVIAVPHTDTPRVQEAQAIAGHIICDLVEQGLGE